MKIKVCWSASTNITFRGEAVVEDMDYDSLDEAYADETNGEYALEASGFEWWIEEVEP